jgi:hypothetical protein
MRFTPKATGAPDNSCIPILLSESPRIFLSGTTITVPTNVCGGEGSGYPDYYLAAVVVTMQLDSEGISVHGAGIVAQVPVSNPCPSK